MQVSKVIKKYGLTLQEVADRLEVKRKNSTGTMNVASLKQLIGKDANPTIGTLKRIADVVGCNWIEFFDDEQTSAPIPEGSTQVNSAIVFCPHCGKPFSIHIKAE